jgi:bacillopeptidase F
MAPEAQLVVAKALDSRGSGKLSTLLAAMQWMLDPDGNPGTKDQPDLVSNSWGASMEAMGDSSEVFRDVVTAWREAGILPVFAVGNEGPGTNSIPAAYPESLAVGATDGNDRSADFSSGGLVQIAGQGLLKPDLSAPGVDILSSLPGSKYGVLSGTSMACPHVAGVLALAQQGSPQANPAQLQYAFEQSVVDLGERGRDGRFGLGRVDLPSALTRLGVALQEEDEDW